MNDQLPLGFSTTCPRCEREHDSRFYGPCESCRAELRLVMRGGGDSDDEG